MIRQFWNCHCQQPIPQCKLTADCFKSNYGKCKGLLVVWLCFISMKMRLEWTHFPSLISAKWREHLFGVMVLKRYWEKPLGFSDIFKKDCLAIQIFWHFTPCLTFLPFCSRRTFQMNPCKSGAVKDEGKYDIGILQRQNEMLSLQSQH